MTREEAVKAAAMGIPVVYLDPMTGKRMEYKRISAVIWRYATLDGTLDEKSISVELLPLNGARSAHIVPLERVEAANREQWAVQKEIAVQPEPEVSCGNSMSCFATLPEPEKPKAKRKVFEKPSVEDVAAYALEMLYDMDAQAFIDHYDSCGWVVGKNKPMRDWKASVRNWVRRQKQFSAEQKEPEPAQSSFETDAFFAAALAKSYGEG